MISLLILLAAAQPADPLAPARAGKLQCYAPDVAKKTCRSIAGYVRQADGSYLNTAKVLIAPDQGIAIETVSVVQVKGEAVCGPILRKDMLAGKVTVMGTALPADQAAMLLGRISDTLDASGMLDKEICTTYVPAGERLIAEATVDGVAKPDANQPVIWVSPAEGYVLGAS